MKTAQRLSGIQEYFFSRKLQEVEQMRKAGADVINLGIGSPDLPPPPNVIETLIERSKEKGVHSYQSYRGVPDFRAAIANWYNKWYHVVLHPQNEILPLIGSKEGIVHVCMAYLDKGDEALVPDPGYPAYKTAVELAGATPITFKLTQESNWLPDLDAISKMDLSRVKLMWVNYTNMPTGKIPDASLFQKLVDFGKANNILICHDNPYSFILNDKPMSILSAKGAMESAIELNSLSKTYNMAGWRVGMLAGAGHIVDEVLKFKSNMDSGMFLPVQLAAISAFSTSADWHQQQNQVYLERRKQATQMLQHLGAAYETEQAGMFLWAKIPDGYRDGVEFCDYLLKEKNVFVTPGIVFGTAGEKYFRLSLCAPVERITETLHRIKN